MTPEKEAELFAALSGIVSKIDRLQTEVSTLRGDVSDLRGDIKAINARLDEQRAWLQSTDQRFTAIMAPYQPKSVA